jgi:hypothetical protein
MTLSIMALSIMALSIMALSTTVICHYAECHCAECRYLFIVMLSASLSGLGFCLCVRLEPCQLDYLTCAPLLGKLLALLKNIGLD